MQIFSQKKLHPRRSAAESEIVCMVDLSEIVFSFDLNERTKVLLFFGKAFADSTNRLSNRTKVNFVDFVGDIGGE